MNNYINLLIIIILSIFIVVNIDYYCNYKTLNTYANDIYAIRPPYKMAKKYKPEKLGPYRILKNNFLNYPIEG